MKTDRSSQPMRSQSAKRSEPNRPIAVRTRCRCKVGNDMNCPYVLPFENVLAKLKEAGYLGYCDEIDAARAVSLMTQCSNCTARGRFEYFGLRKNGTYRAFWVCLRCKHWLEV